MSSTQSPKDWLILQCQACGSPMKVRAEAVAGQRVACPGCGSAVSVQLPPGASSSPEFKAHMPGNADRVSDPQQRRGEDYSHDEEFAPSPLVRQAPRPGAQTITPDQAPDAGFLSGLQTTGDRQSGKRVKVKKRRKNASPDHHELLADWDTSLESLPEAELYSDPWTTSVPIPEEVIKEKTRDFVVEGVDEDGATVRRVKRVRKRRLFSWAQLFFRRLSMGMRILTLSVVGAIAVGGFYYAIKIFREHFKPVTYDDVAADSRPDRRNLVEKDETSAFEAVKGFLAAKGMDAKMPFVRLPNRVRPLMQKYYGRAEDRPIVGVSVRNRDKFVSQGAYFVILEVEVKDPATPERYNSVRHFAVEELEDENGHRSYLVDWETAVEWREMSFDDFKKDRPQGNVPFRVKLRGSDYYNHGFSDEKKWFATEIYFPQQGVGNEIMFYGYMDRNSEVFKKLSPTLVSGLNPAVIVNIRYPAKTISPEQVVIDSLVHDSWFYVKDVPTK